MTAKSRCALLVRRRYAGKTHRRFHVDPTLTQEQRQTSNLFDRKETTRFGVEKDTNLHCIICHYVYNQLRNSIVSEDLSFTGYIAVAKADDKILH